MITGKNSLYGLTNNGAIIGQRLTGFLFSSNPKIDIHFSLCVATNPPISRRSLKE